MHAPLHLAWDDTGSVRPQISEGLPCASCTVHASHAYPLIAHITPPLGGQGRGLGPVQWHQGPGQHFCVTSLVLAIQRAVLVQGYRCANPDFRKGRIYPVLAIQRAVMQRVGCMWTGLAVLLL